MDKAARSAIDGIFGSAGCACTGCVCTGCGVTGSTAFDDDDDAHAASTADSRTPVTSFMRSM
jgi:hypothetical protein